MMQSPKNKVFTAADIERYHSGQMSEQERHALEKAALDDPFLADALEGYAYTTTAAEDLRKIQERLQEKKKEQPKVIPLFSRRTQWMRIAAAVVVIAGAGWLAVTMLNPDNQQLAKTPEEKTVPLDGQADRRQADSGDLVQNTWSKPDSNSYTLSSPRVQLPDNAEGVTERA